MTDKINIISGADITIVAFAANLVRATIVELYASGRCIETYENLRFYRSKASSSIAVEAIDSLEIALKDVEKSGQRGAEEDAVRKCYSICDMLKQGNTAKKFAARQLRYFTDGYFDKFIKKAVK